MTEKGRDSKARGTRNKEMEAGKMFVLGKDERIGKRREEVRRGKKRKK